MATGTSSTPFPTLDRAQAMSAVLAQNWWAVALRGVFAILFGLIALFMPGATMLSLVLFFAAYMLVDGVFGIVAAVKAASDQPALGPAGAGGHRRHRGRRHRLPVARPDGPVLRHPDGGSGR